MKKKIILFAALALAAQTLAATPAGAALYNNPGASRYPLGSGQCLYFQGCRFWVAPC